MATAVDIMREICDIGADVVKCFSPMQPGHRNIFGFDNKTEKLYVFL